jgi:hypothetical protein
MKVKMVFGALMLSVALCSQGMALELLDSMAGINAGGCAPCAAPAPCAPAVKCCAPEPTCCDPCAKRCDLFAGLKDLFACKRCCDPCGPAAECKTCAPEPAPCAPVCGGCGDCCDCRPVRNLLKAAVEPIQDLKCALISRPCASACAPACEAPKACAPVCKPCKVKVCKPVCEAPKACAPVGCNDCGKCCRCRPVLTFLDNLFSALKPCRPCAVACGEPSCCGATVVPGPVPAPAPAPAAAPAPAEAAPLPAAPKADPSASLMRSRSIYQATASIVQN